MTCYLEASLIYRRKESRQNNLMAKLLMGQAWILILPTYGAIILPSNHFAFFATRFEFAGKYF
jgi:hypothetical protein